MFCLFSFRGICVVYVCKCAVSNAVMVELTAGFDKHDPYQECQIQLQTLQKGAAVHI